MKQSRPKKPRWSKTRRARPALSKEQREARSELIAWVSKLKSAPCPDCGNSFPLEAMDWDHLPGFTKRFTISEFVRTKSHLKNARKLLEAEIAKCELCCSNCHRIRTKNRAKGKRDKRPVWW